MQEERIYQDDPMCAALETEVIGTGQGEDGPWVRLARTPFYPEGGGQPADHGTIGPARVLDVQKDGDRVLHFVDREVSGAVEARIDWERRWDFMQQHTAQHLLTATLHNRHDRRTLTFHLGMDYAAIDLDGTVPPQQTLDAWEDEVNALVREDRAVEYLWAEPNEMEELGVRSRRLPEGHTGRVRLVRIEGVDLNTCGGTHVPGLAHLQYVRITGAEPARGGMRLTFLAGGRVARRLREADALESALKERLCTSPDQFAQVIDGWMAERRTLARRVRDLEAESVRSLAREMAAADRDRLARVVPSAGPDVLDALARAVLDLRPEAVVALVGVPEDGPPGFLVQAGPEGPGDVSAWGARLRDALGGKGGGRGRRFQGRGARVPGDWSIDAIFD